MASVTISPLNLGNTTPRFVSAAVSAAATAICANDGPGVLHYVRLTTIAGTLCHFRMWNTSAGVVVGTTAPDMIFEIGSAASLVLIFCGGITFDTNIQIAAAVEAGTAGATAASALSSEVTLGIVSTT